MPPIKSHPLKNLTVPAGKKIKIKIKDIPAPNQVMTLPRTLNLLIPASEPCIERLFNNS